MTPYEILNISPDANDVQIKQAYLQKVRNYPPDHAPQQFQRIREAYEQIETEQKRLAYELFHTHEPTIPEIIGHLLQQSGQPQRPKLAALRSALNASLKSEP